MSELVDILRDIVRQEMAARRTPELAIVTAVFPGDGSEGNHQADVRLRESGLTLLRVPVAVARPGLSVLPREGDPVVVVFLGGDVAQPVVLGSVHSAQEQPPEAGPLEVVYVPSDAQESGVRRLHVETPSGGMVTLDDETLVAELGGSTLTINQDGDIEIAAAGNLVLTAGGDVTIEAGTAIEAKAGTDAKIEASVAFEAKGVTAKVEGSATADLKAGLITIAGTTNLSPS